MSLVNETDLKSAIRNGKFSKVYHFYGKDIAEIEKTTKLLLSKALKKDDEAYNLHTFEGKNIDIGSLCEACEAIPMFADYVCCTVCDLNAEQLNADSLNTLIAAVNDLPDTTILIFYNTSVDVTDGKKYPTAKNKKLIDAVSKCGTVCNFAYKTALVLSKDIMAKCKNRISKQAAEYLANLCGCNTMIIENEIEKLLSYTNGGEITIEIINMLSPKQLESTTFDLAKAIVKHDKNTAIRLLDELMQQKIEPVPIMYAITGNMMDLYRAKAALGARKGAVDVVNDFSYAKNISFRVENAFKDIRSLSITHLRECMRILTEADIAMKSLKTSNQTILEEAVIKMISHK